MIEDEQTQLKNKISEMKQRLHQIYAQYFTDTSTGKVFETEFSLYLKACENARNEILESIKLQFYTIKIGMVVLISASALSVYLLKSYAFFGMLVLLGFGFCACGFMYIILAGEIRIKRAAGFCEELETYFQRFRWSTELKKNLNLPDIPLWGEYIRKWDEDKFDDGLYEKKVLYAPFRIIITFVDLLALVFLIQSFLFREYAAALPVVTVSLFLWTVAVIAQILIVHSIQYKVDSRLLQTEEKRPGVSGRKKITGEPRTWINILKIFLLLDIIFPKLKKTASAYDHPPEDNPS